MVATVAARNAPVLTSSPHARTAFSLFICAVASSDEKRAATSTLFFADLAGSERLSKLEGCPQLLAESKNINLSLLSLEKVILALEEAHRGNRAHVPFRSSALTSYLRSCFAADSLILMLFAVNGNEAHLDESVATLKFAMRCRNVEIRPSPVVVAQPAEDVRMARKIDFLHRWGKQPVD